jgi:outer membrane lipoprotein-sorting protein
MLFWHESQVKRKKTKVKSSRLPLFAFLFLLFAFAALSACTIIGPREEAPLKRATAEELMALLHERDLAMQTMKGLFSAKIKGGILPIGQRVEGALYYRRPNAMRLQGFNAVGGELFDFVLANDQYRLRLPTMGRVLTGRPSAPEGLGKLGRPFQLSLWAMSGVVGASSIGKQERVILIEDAERYRLDVFGVSADTTQSTVVRRLWFDRQHLLVVQEERLTPSGAIEAVMRYDDYRLVGDAARDGSSPGVVDRQLLRPFKVSMEDGQGQGSLQVTFHEIQPNAQLKPNELGQG